MQALYRKYRPKIFDDLYGQNTIVETLKRQVEENETSHAYLFSGTRGTGKTSAAKILSRAVNCEAPVAGNPCNQCSSCRGILNEKVLDVVEMDAASHNGVDDIRQLKEQVIYEPSVVENKVYIIDEVHMLSKGAFNALLKILEEPPAHLIFILATTEPERIPATIISRTQRFHFHRITESDLIKNMERILEIENINYDVQALSLIAAHSDGAMRDALSILDQCLSLANGNQLTEDLVFNILGLTGNDSLFKICQGLANGDTTKVLQDLREEYVQGRNMNLFLEGLTKIYRDLLVYKTTGVDLNHLTEEENKQLKNLSAAFTLESIFSGIDILSKAKEQARFSQDPLFLCEVTLLQLIYYEQSEKESINSEKESINLSPSVVNDRKNSSQNLITKKSKKQNDKELTKNKRVLNKQQKDDIIKSSSSKNEEDERLKEIKDNWPKVQDEVRRRRVSVHALIRDTEPISYKNSVLTVGFQQDCSFHMKAMENDENKKMLQEVVSEIFNEKMEIRYDFIKDANEKAIDEVVEIFGKENIEIIDE